MILTQMEAMGLTLVIEGAAAYALAPMLAARPAACALSAILASTLTHPILWAIFYSVHDVLGPVTTPALEAIIFLAEAPFYRMIARTTWNDALVMSVIVNAASWGAGEAIYALA